MAEEFIHNLKDGWKSSPQWAKIIFWCLLVLCFVVFCILLYEPPEWDITENALKGLTIFLGFASFGMAIECIDKGLDISMKHGDTEITVNHNGDSSD